MLKEIKDMTIDEIREEYKELYENFLKKNFPTFLRTFKWILTWA